MEFIIHVMKEMIFFLNEVSVYLLFGFFIAGLLHVIFPESMIRKHLGKNTVGSVVKATVFGIPLPLCSCGVVPVAASLRNSGASKGSSVSFMISTPEVGADSFLITYSLLGWIFGVFRIAASLITAMVAGVLINLTVKEDPHEKQTFPMAPAVQDGTLKARAKTLFHYIQYDLLGSLANTLIIGIIIAGIIAALIPDTFFQIHLNNSFLSMVLMMGIGIPMYVCAAASTPIAASLILKGMSPGAALVFLLTGPATNAITISTVITSFGKKAAAIYLLAIGTVSITLGYLLDMAVATYGLQKIILTHQHEILPEWFKILGTVVLILMLLRYYAKTIVKDRFPSRGRAMEKDDRIRLKIIGMTCMHCANNVRKAVESVKGTSNVSVNLNKKFVEFVTDDSLNIKDIKTAIAMAGFRCA